MRNPKAAQPQRQKNATASKKIGKNKLSAAPYVNKKMFKDYIIQILDRQFPV